MQCHANQKCYESDDPLEATYYFRFFTQGHFDCVDFLVKFGVNIFSLDIDMHTPKELAAMNDCSEILR